ncbi:MAG TPA: hypothetical protein VFO55_01050 [Gemmatimonadaceae bacterium]|nr:hypothetical protein [Gemmatimonadaceae bacterium]
MQLTTKQYDELERAVRDGARVSVMRRGTEYLVVPMAIGIRGGKEAITARNPTTGDEMIILLEDMEGFVVVK